MCFTYENWSIFNIRYHKMPFRLNESLYGARELLFACWTFSVISERKKHPLGSFVHLMGALLSPPGSLEL